MYTYIWLILVTCVSVCTYLLYQNIQKGVWKGPRQGKWWVNTVTTKFNVLWKHSRIKGPYEALIIVILYKT